jgi:homocysteine S-methyltransferase
VVSFVVPDDAVLVADGCLATELEARGNDVSDPLWSARLLLDAPEQVRDAHLAFFRAGAVIATSASYQASFEGFARRGLDRAAAAGLMRRNVDLARGARAEMAGDGQARWVAASVGPYGAALADGSEYRPAACLDGAVPVLRQAAAAVDGGGGENRGRVLPGPAR